MNRDRRDFSRSSIRPPYVRCRPPRHTFSDSEKKAGKVQTERKAERRCQCVKVGRSMKSECSRWVDRWTVHVHISSNPFKAHSIRSMHVTVVMLSLSCYCYYYYYYYYYQPGQLSLYSDSLRAGRPGDRITVEASFCAQVQTGSEAYPTSYKMGAESFPGVKRSRRGVDHTPPSGAEVKERVELYLYSPSEPS